MDDELRELLSRKAAEIEPTREVPVSLTGRANRRIALNGAALGAVVLLVAGGVFLGAQVFGGSEAPRPIVPASSPSAEPKETVPISTPSSGPTTSDRKKPCTAGQLRAVGSFEGAAGSREGAVQLTNLSDEMCTLEGTPMVKLLDDNGAQITTGVTFSSAPAGWEVNASPKPSGWPVVTLAPGDTASVRIRWSNWCPDGRNAPLWQMDVTGGGVVNVMGFEAAAPPPCNGAGQTSTIEVGPFEPGA